MKDWFKNRGISDDKIHDLNWWESVQHSEQLKFVCTPCQHWTKSKKLNKFYNNNKKLIILNRNFNRYL